MKHTKLARNFLTILTIILGCLAFYAYQNAPIREEVIEACPICPAFSIEKVKDTSKAKSYAIAGLVSGSLFLGTTLYLRKTKRTK